MKKLSLIALTACFLAMMLFGIETNIHNGHVRDLLQARIHKLDQYCLRVKWSIEQDAQDLAGGTPQRQLEASRRFGEGVSGHSYDEIAMCVAGETIPQWDQHMDCHLKNDFRCLSDIASAVARAIDEPGITP